MTDMWDRFQVPFIERLRCLTLDEAYDTRYSVHLGEDKKHFDQRKTTEVTS